MESNQIIKMLISLVYDLCPDEEFEELYEIEEKIQQAEQYLAKVEGAYL